MNGDFADLWIVPAGAGTTRVYAARFRRFAGCLCG
jgi:hypothetical protein